MGFTGMDIEVTDGLRIKENTLYSKELFNADGVLWENYIHDTFQGRPIFVDDLGYGNPTGATGDVNHMWSGNNYFEYHIKGAGQTILAPTWVTGSGLNIAMDQAADEGIEITNGIGASSKMYFDVSTDNCFFEVTLLPADVSGTDDLCVGFRKAEAYQAAVDNYDEAAYFQIVNTAVNIETILNNAATSTTATSATAADNVAITLRIEIVDRVATFKVNGSTPATTVSFTFDANEKVVPFLYFLHHTDLMDTLYLQKWECGKLYPATTN